MNGNATSTQRTALLDAAAELIRAEGAEGWTLEALAERCAVGPAAVRAEFASEWEAFCEVIRRDERRFEDIVDASQAATPGERLVSFIETCVPNFDWSYWIELWSVALREERARALRNELDVRFRAMIEKIVRQGVEAGEFSASDTGDVAITIATLIDAMALQATLGDTTIRPNYMLDACVTVCGALLDAPLELPQLTEDADG